MAKKKSSDQDLAAGKQKTYVAPTLPIAPPKTKRYNPPIGLIGCGGISEQHLKAYKAAGYNVVALCDLIPERAENRRAMFFPKADLYTDYRELLARDDIEVVDLATHPQDREYLIPAAIEAGKHVLSHKPFVLDLDKGRKFDALAKKRGVKLAINQNGRWAPYFSYLRQAVARGLIGEPMAVHLACHWNHEWIRKTHFNGVHHIVLYDFAIHWFDMLNCLMLGKQARRVTASLTYAKGQQSTPPLLGQAIVEYDDGQASLVFDAATPFGNRETAFVMGSAGTLEAVGQVVSASDLTLTTTKGVAKPDVGTAHWFPTGFHGSMAELLCAIEQDREPINNPLDNLKGLAICFAAVASAESGKPVEVGKVKKVPVERCSVAAAKPAKAKAKAKAKPAVTAESRAAAEQERKDAEAAERARQWARMNLQSC
ncbi:MAG TPA: Gfo/Idh/MocA family oxidoreductase [Tepidisphaeraceae bacterium]|nr:Gfo/Idh/MocA family oxidoreductase [Tepidisphaeraceae bacterium]